MSFNIKHKINSLFNIFFDGMERDKKSKTQFVSLSLYSNLKEWLYERKVAFTKRTTIQPMQVAMACMGNICEYIAHIFLSYTIFMIHMLKMLNNDKQKMRRNTISYSLSSVFVLSWAVVLDVRDLDSF